MKLKNIIPLFGILLVMFMSGCKKNTENTDKPMVSSTDPYNTAVGVAINSNISATFNVIMDQATINTTTFTLSQGSTSVPGSVTYADKVATFSPTTNLDPGKVYTATITTGAKDITDNQLSNNYTFIFTTSPAASSILPVVNLGSAANYVILAKTEITNVPTSAITGDMGLSPAATSYITGFAMTMGSGYSMTPQVMGKIYAADMMMPTSGNLTTAVSNMQTAYTDAAGRTNPNFNELYTGNLGGKTLVPGLYKWTNTVTMPTNLTISGGPNDVWIFQIAGNLLMSFCCKHIPLRRCPGQKHLLAGCRTGNFGYNFTF